MTGGRLTKGITGQNSDFMKLNILGDVTLGNEMANGSIQNVSVSIGEGKKLTITDMNKEGANVVWTNNGTMDILGGNSYYNNQSTGYITGTGQLNILGNINLTYYNKTVTQGDLYIDDDGALTVASNGMVVNTLVNDGKLSLNGSDDSGARPMTAANVTSEEITGDGIIWMQNGQKGSINGVTVSQDIQIDTGARLTINPDSINSTTITNNGILSLKNYGGTLKDGLTINGNGTLDVDFSVVQNYAQINNNLYLRGRGFTTNADLLNGTIYLAGNYPNILLTGGNLNENCTVSGSNAFGVYIATEATVTFW